MDPLPEESPDLERLVREAVAGDAAARERLVAGHLPGLRAYVRLRLNPTLRAKESCSDVVQSICREVVENLGRFEYRGEASFRLWLYRSALNKIIDKQRYWLADRRDPGRERAQDPRDSRSRVLSDSYATITTPSRVAMDREGVARIESAFDRLPDRYRAVILLSRIVGLPHREIARQMGKTEQATRTLLRRALVRLAGILDEAGG